MNTTDKAIADIRNKMGYVSNLLYLLDLEVKGHWVEDRIKELLPKSKESIEWLRNIKAENYENNNKQL